MRIEKLTLDRLHDFLLFCETQRSVIDESFLYDDDLRDFVLDATNPTYVAISAMGAIVGAASVMNSSYYQRGRKGRFRIFHVLADYDGDIYAQLLSRITEEALDLDELYLFVREDNRRVRHILESMHFDVERYAHFMVRNAAPVEPPEWEDGYAIQAMVFNRDEADYCHVRNLGFATLTGSQTPITLEEASRLKDGDDYIESGIFLLYHHAQPVGVVRTAEDVHDGARVINIGPLALVPAYQGQGLGRQLLRAALSFGRHIGLETAVLSANVDNENAVRLYLSEGFQTAEAVVCYTYRLPQ